MLKIESNDTYFSADFCDSCKGAPAAFLCKADSASLCAACDAEIHSANPLAGRHHRVPIEANWGGGFLNGEDEVGSWLLMKGGEYLELDEYKGGDSVVPIDQYDHHCFHSELEAGSYGYPAASISQTVSISSMEVPVESTLWHRPPKGTIDLFSSPAVPPIEVLSPRDREARVMRYREKKKNRRFEKTIRYASRKAYAESRPRIKGRFAKRNSGRDRDRDHPQLEVDHIFSSHVDTLYGVVPSF